MKLVKNTLFAFALVAGLAVGAFAQKDGDKKPPPPKNNPPVVVVPPKNPPPQKPPDKKKPGGFESFFWKTDESESA